MSIKRKLILIGVCFAIIIVVFTVNVIRLMKPDQPKDLEESVVKENIISRAEAYRFLSYLEYDKVGRESIPFGVTYADKNMSGWYDSYVNAVWKMGLIEGEVSITRKEALTYGACKELIDKLIIKKPEYQSIYTGLSFDFIKAEEEMLIPQFLEIYEAILAITPDEQQTVKSEMLFVLGREVSEDGKDRIVTDMGKYYYQDAQSYENYYEQMKQAYQAEEDNSAGNAEDITPEVTENATGSELDAEAFVESYTDKGINVLTCGQEIICITSVSLDKIVIHNVWIKEGKDQLVDTFVSGIDKSFQAKFPLSDPIEKVVGDITIENQKVVQISVKPDMIQGKVLLTGEDFIEIEGYGKVPLDEEYKIYKLYGELSMEPTGSILVGYETTDFVVSDGKISAALIKESIKAENIRVLIKTTDFEDIYHKKVELTANKDFTISSKGKKTNFAAGDKVTIEMGDDLLSEGRIKIETEKNQGKIQILSIERSSGNPKYRGSIEIAEGDNGLLIVNELPLEEYLYAVIPSEMPTSYGAEALKVQAVCARSYSYKHLLANSLSKYGAHVDDSVSYQVYNNIAENEDSVLAVKDTYGKVIEYDGDVITAYYFSTSCGHTTDAMDVWVNGVAVPYLTGKLIAPVEDGEDLEAQEAFISEYQDLSEEENFRSFIDEKDLTTYDSKFNWYRWNVSMDVKEIKKVIDNNLLDRYNANPELIQTMTSDAQDDEEAVFESIPVDTVGTVEDITVLKREAGGIISELLITGSKNTVKVETEYNIRILLAPAYDTVIRQDLTKVEDLNLLPSAFFYIDEKEKSGKLNTVTLTGGGYGHGVGMSQNGVKALADTGKKYEDIVAYFYEGTEMGFIYE